MDNSTKVKILIIDPQRSVRNSLKERLEFENYNVQAVESLEEAYVFHEKNPCNILLIDGDLSERYIASENVGRFKDSCPIILSANPSIQTAVYSIRNGAFDFVPKPVDMNQLLSAIKGVIAMYEEENSRPVRLEHHHENFLRERGSFEKNRNCHCPERDSDVETIIGDSDSIRAVKLLIDKVGPSDARVMITGPNGTGKELVARWLHEKSARCGSPFVEVNCAAIPSELIESELFGHEKGAFTSAVKQRKGKFEQADKGTLFLDEIGDMSLSAQAKVLRALQEHKISRVGGDKDIDIDVRVISATNKNLREEIQLGNFREDLYHRLSVIVIPVPKLVERLDDIPLLVNYFTRKICAEYNIPIKPVDGIAVKELQTMDWTGNIRELRNVVERLIILSGDHITLEDVKTYAPATG